MRRSTLFWLVCIPTRAYLASRGNDPLLRIAAGAVSYRWLWGLEDNHIGAFGGPAFWADERPWHGLLWGLYAVSGRAAFLWVDTTFGAAKWIAHHLR